MRVAEGPLADPARAFAYASRALRESAGEPEFPQWLERAERLAERDHGAYADLVELLRAVVARILDEDLQLDVTRKIAELAQTKLDDAAARAQRTTSRALEIEGDDTRALAALETALRGDQRRAALLDILKRRAEVAATDDARKVILYKQARLCDETLKDTRAAIEVYEQILELGVEPQALGRSSACIRRPSAGRISSRSTSGSSALDGHVAGAKAELHHDLGAFSRRARRHRPRLRRSTKRRLAIEQHEATIKSLERLMAERAHCCARGSDARGGVSRASRLAQGDGHARGPPRRERGARGASHLLRRLVKLHEEQEENYKAALEITAKLLAEDITDEATWAELERLARVANAEERLAEIYAAELEKITNDEPATARLAQRTGELFEAARRRGPRAAFYRRAYAFAPEEDKQSLPGDRSPSAQASKRPADRVALYRDAARVPRWTGGALSILHTIAQIEEKELSDDDAAIVTLRAVSSSTRRTRRARRARAPVRAARALARPRRSPSTPRRAERLPDDEAKWRLQLGRLLEHEARRGDRSHRRVQAVLELVPPARRARR